MTRKLQYLSIFLLRERSAKIAAPEQVDSHTNRVEVLTRSEEKSSSSECGQQRSSRRTSTKASKNGLIELREHLLLQPHMDRSEGHATSRNSEVKAGPVLIREHYRNKGSITWYFDLTGTAAIWVWDGIRVRVLDQDRGNGFRWI